MKIFHLKTKPEDLLEKLKKGDRKAQSELYKQLASRMLGICRRYVKRQEEAEEVLMNGMVKVFNNIHSFTGEGSFEGWIKRIMVNESINYIRYQKNLFIERDEQDWPEDTHSPIDSNENTEVLLQLIDELPLGYRTVFNLFAIEGYNHKEISELLSIEETTSKSQLSRARKYLQERITQNQYLYKP